MSSDIMLSGEMIRMMNDEGLVGDAEMKGEDGIFGDELAAQPCTGADNCVVTSECEDTRLSRGVAPDKWLRGGVRRMNDESLLGDDKMMGEDKMLGDDVIPGFA